MPFIECAEQGCVYHVVNIIDLEKTLQEGIRFDDKNTYLSKYLGFHSYFDQYKPRSIPQWVERKKAIFASVRFRNGHTWHSHSAILKIKIQKGSCWVCNENLANFIYEPFILQSLKGFEDTREYMRLHGRAFVEEYWSNSLSYEENIQKRYDEREGYDAEILVMHPIPPQDIECLYIVSDHQIMSYKQWQAYFKPGSADLKAQYNRYLHPESISND
jgi:hypothetical protein